MKIILSVLVGAAVLSVAHHPAESIGKKEQKLMKITPILIVDNIEKSLPFWIDRMGFQKTVELPEGDRLGFVILTHEGAELMMQTTASVKKDDPQAAARLAGGVSSLYIEVPDFEDVLKRLRGYPIAMAERKAFYGMREIGVTEPGGHNVMFAARVEK